MKPDPAHQRAPRDIRLDFFRGLAMFIILIAHIPGNSWFDYIPARFGFSSAAELFVFCSGLASSLAFGRVFIRDGMLAGSFRILKRIWQVYWAHIGLALGMMAISVIGLKITGTDYPSRLGMTWFAKEPVDGVFRLLTLRYIPNYLDVLPMYLVLLAMIPLVVLAGRRHSKLAATLLILLWCAVQLGTSGFGPKLALPGGPEPHLSWYFNPFGWQIIFFTGFFIGMGWVAVPALKTGRLFWCALAFLFLSVPVNFWAFTDASPLLESIHDALVGPTGKTNFNALLPLHFLASAYVVLTLIDRHRETLARITPMVLVGQQALACFLASILLAWGLGILLDITGRTALSVALANLTGFAGLIFTARIAAAYKSR